MIRALPQKSRRHDVSLCNIYADMKNPAKSGALQSIAVYRAISISAAARIGRDNAEYG